MSKKGSAQRPGIRVLLAILSLGAIGLLLQALLPRQERIIRSQVQLGEGPSPEGFTQAVEGRELRFPDDFGPHDDYQSEWWYYTGNLQTAAGRHFGYQLTFFRRALAPPQDVSARESAWASEQIYFAHFTVTDVERGAFQAFERFSRAAAGLAGAEPTPYHVWLESWSVTEVGPDQYRLMAAEDGLELDLLLTDTKGPVLQGENGYSQKGPAAGSASYYYSLTNLASRGRVTIQDQSFEVQGKSWMDHEFSTSALSEEQVGWDWFSVQLDDETELMLFQIRQADGTVDPFSSGTLIDREGGLQHLSREDFSIEVLDDWVSPRSGAVYPAGWIVRIPTANLELEISPLLADQELDVSFVYWEGAVSVAGTRSGTPVQGFGYTELTGYFESIAGVF